MVHGSWNYIETFGPCGRALKGITIIGTAWSLLELEPHEEKGGVKILNNPDKHAEQTLIDGFIVRRMIDWCRFGSL